MLLKGRYGDTTKRPYTEGRVWLTTLGCWGDISFLIDTGADRTTIMPADGIKLGIEYENLENPQSTLGIGQGTCHPEKSVVIFANSETACCYVMDVLILEPFELEGFDGPPPLPSLLGRDILNRWDMRISPRTNELTIEVKEADGFLGENGFILSSPLSP